jgi:hypothetical protein
MIDSINKSIPPKPTNHKDGRDKAEPLRRKEKE